VNPIPRDDRKVRCLNADALVSEMVPLWRLGVNVTFERGPARSEWTAGDTIALLIGGASQGAGPAAADVVAEGLAAGWRPAYPLILLPPAEQPGPCVLVDLRRSAPPTTPFERAALLDVIAALVRGGMEAARAVVETTTALPALESLAELGSHSTVRRGGRSYQVQTEVLVDGDEVEVQTTVFAQGAVVESRASPIPEPLRRPLAEVRGLVEAQHAALVRRYEAATSDDPDPWGSPRG